MIAALVITFLGVSAVSGQYWGAPVYHPLAILAHNPFSYGRSVVKVPLVLVPQNTLNLLDNVHISSVSPTEPLVTCQVQTKTLDATPVVRVTLDSPIVVSSPEVLVGFPSQVNVIHEGLRISVPVGSLLAPVPDTRLIGPHVIRYVYALPSAPLHLRYPFYHPFQYIRPQQVTTSVQTVPLADKKPTSEKRPIVTILDFPSQLASPTTLFYQPPVEDELGNRNPPEAIAPAGIVQSAQPHLVLYPFYNPKESPLLQALRDEAEKKKNLETDKTGGVEAL